MMCKQWEGFCGALILWLQSPSAVILELRKIISVTISNFPPSICKDMLGLDTMIFMFWMSRFFFLFFFSFIFISWMLITLLLWVLSYIDMNQPWSYMYSPSRSPIPTSSPPDSSWSCQCTSPEHLSHASNLGWWSVSLKIIYMFRCCSLKTSHPPLLPQSPKVCSVHLCLFFCFAYRVIINIFLNSIYVC